MKKIVITLFSMFAFIFIFSSSISAQYNGNLGYEYSNANTKFYYYSDDENISDVYLNILSDSKKMILDSSGVRVITVGSDLNNIEYNYTVCYQDSTCVDTYDPFAYSISNNKNIIIDNNLLTIDGFETLSSIEFSDRNKSIYALDADIFTKDIEVNEVEGVVTNNSVFNKLITEATYKGNTNTSIGFKYLSSLGVSYVEIGELYDANNYFYPNLKYSSVLPENHPVLELKKLVSVYKESKMNIILRTNFITPSEGMKNALLVQSSDYVVNGKINLNNPIMQRYILDVYKYWINEYKVDGFYIEDANLYPSDYLNSLITEVNSINKKSFVYTNLNNGYFTNDNLQNILFGDLTNSNKDGILNGDFRKENFDALVNSMFSGYYSDISKYTDASKVINNIGSLYELDIYSKLRLAAGLDAKPIDIYNKVQSGLYTIYSSVGIPRLVAGNEFLNNTEIPTEEKDSFPQEDLICDSFCYGKNSLKALDWGYLATNSSKLSIMLRYRNLYDHQFPSLYVMKYSKKIEYNKELVESGILYLTIEYDPRFIGDNKRSVLIFNYSNENINVGRISDKNYANLPALLGSIEVNGDDTLLGGYTMFTLTETNEKKFAEWVYVVVAVLLMGIIFGGRSLLVKLLKDKKGIDYNNEVKVKRKEKKKKEKKQKRESIFKSFLKDDPLFSRNKKEEKKEEIIEVEKEEVVKTENNDTDK